MEKILTILELLFFAVVLYGILWILYRLIFTIYSSIASILLFKKSYYLLITLKTISVITVAFSSYFLINNFPVGCADPMDELGSESKPYVKRRKGKMKYSSSEYDALELVRGKLSYHIPDTMEVGNKYFAKVAITEALSDSILLNGFSKDEINRSTIVDSISISSRVKVSLIDPEGDNFYVKSINTELQIVDNKSNTVWNWYIIPKTSGINPLELTVSTRITDKLGTDFRDIPVLSRSVTVTSNYWYSTKNFSGQYWQYILSAVLIPLVVWRYNLYKNQQDEKQKKQDEALQKKIDEDAKNPIGFKPNQKKPD